jgi:hypothetical protein
MLATDHIQGLVVAGTVGVRGLAGGHWFITRVLPRRETRVVANCNTSCYSSPNIFLITFIYGLIMHQVIWLTKF